MTPVTLRDGPYHGRTVDIDPARTMFTWAVPLERVERDWDGLRVWVTVVEPVTYWRVSATEFEWCRTPTQIGDRDLAIARANR